MQLYPGASVGLIAAAPRHRLLALTSEEVNDVVELSAAPEEVLYRVRRVASGQGCQPPAVELGELTLHPARALVLVAQQPVTLRLREFELLRFLASRPNRVFRREELIREVWGSEYRGSPRTVDTHIRRLRDRLGTFGQRHLQTVRGVGYRLASPQGSKPEEASPESNR